MRVFVACEYSGRVRDAFLARGHNAISCDLLPTRAPGPHIQADVQSLQLRDYDLLVAFPPCTFLSSAGAWHNDGTQEQADALSFVLWLMAAPVPRIAIENPQGKINTWIRKPDQTIQPWQFGEHVTKRTCLWLSNLPLLRPTSIVTPDTKRWTDRFDGRTQALERSLTFRGIAEAMAEQWGRL